MFPIYFAPQRFFSHFLILLSVIVSIGGFLMPNMLRFGMSEVFLGFGMYGSFLIQIVLYQFLHGWPLHLLLNSLFLYQAGPELEARMSATKYKLFFVANTFFVAIALLIFSSGNTVGISGFCMALLSYLWIDLYKTRHPMADQILVMLVINVWIWLSPGISLVGHAAGAVFGLLWWWMKERRW